MSHSQTTMQPLPPMAPPPAPLNSLRMMPPSVSAMSKNQIDECLWALEHPELQKACFLARICPMQPPNQCQYRNVVGLQQVGPTCGLTALSMLLGGAPPPEQLLAAAKEQHFTNNGEMFSAQNLYQLICENIMAARNLPATSIECAMHEGRLNCAKVKNSLLAGDCLFVPYDPDFNHAPCLKFGHKAHWALIVGHLISDTNKFYVLARHGKAKNLAVWSLEELSDSNSNLIEFSQPKGYPDCDFLLPPGGIGGDLGLRERAIIVKGLPNATISIR